MSTLLRSRQNAVLSPFSMRSLLDSLASRLDEARDISRYLVALLIFLGLLGTFWGLLATVTSIGSAISALDVTSGQSSTVFENLKEGLKGPLERHGPFLLVLDVRPGGLADPGLSRSQGRPGPEPLL